MAFDFGGLASGVGSLLGAAGTLAGSFQDAPKPQQQGFRGLISTPGYTMGGGTLQRKSDPLAQTRRLRDLYGTLRTKVPDLTTSGVNAIRQASAREAGNLRTQLARRGLAGASFADDQINRVMLAYQDEENKFRQQAQAQEIAMQTELLDREYQTVIADAELELAELGFAGGFLGQVNQALLDQKSVKAALAQAGLLGQVTNPEATPATPAPAPATPRPGPVVPRPRPNTAAQVFPRFNFRGAL